jgi:hypothetical protein
MTNWVVEPACQPWNRFLGSFKGLQIRALHDNPIPTWFLAFIDCLKIFAQNFYVCTHDIHYADVYLQYTVWIQYLILPRVGPFIISTNHATLLACSVFMQILPRLPHEHMTLKW